MKDWQCWTLIGMGFVSAGLWLIHPSLPLIAWGLLIMAVAKDKKEGRQND